MRHNAKRCNLCEKVRKESETPTADKWGIDLSSETEENKIMWESIFKANYVVEQAYVKFLESERKKEELNKQKEELIKQKIEESREKIKQMVELENLEI